MGDAFKALADPTRRRILELLAQGDLTAGEIAAQFDMTKPSVSHHLNILKEEPMMKNNKLGSLFWILLVVCILNIVGHLAVYPALPDTVPTHWGASGEVNGWSSKQSNLIFCVLPLAMLVFMEVVRRIDPKHQNFERFGKVWNILSRCLCCLCAA